MDISVFMSGSLDGDTTNAHVSAEAFRYKIKALQETFSALERARQPVLAAIQGGAIGAGVDLATACDWRYASADAFFAVQETAIGMTADVGTFPRLVKLIPEGWARQMAYTAGGFRRQKRCRSAWSTRCLTAMKICLKASWRSRARLPHIHRSPLPAARRWPTIPATIRPPTRLTTFRSGMRRCCVRMTSRKPISPRVKSGRRCLTVSSLFQGKKPRQIRF